jgi:hypothetical protein
MVGALTLIAAVTLTATMFTSRNWMLGFPSAIFWFLFGGYCYNLSAAPWDMYFVTAFASILGLGVFSMYAAYGLREKKDTGTDKDEYVDENPDSDKFYGETKREGNLSNLPGEKESFSSMNDGYENSDGGDHVSRQANRVRARAKKRRDGIVKSKENWGAFK